MKMSAIFLAVIAAGAGAFAADVVYDAGGALAANLGKGGTFTDCTGGVWTFGTLGASDLSDIQAFSGNYSDGVWFEGVTGANNSYAPPFAIVNTSNTPQTHGGETGNIALEPGEIVMHPNNPKSAARPDVGIRYKPPRAGIYRITAAVRDMSYGKNYDGVIVALHANGMILQETLVGREIGVTNVTLTAVVFLAENESVTMIVDPRETYNCDSTGVFFTLTELAAIPYSPVFNLNEAYLNILRSGSPALPATVDDAEISTGMILSNRTELVWFTTHHGEARISSDGFSAASGFPYVLANTNDAPSACDNNILNGKYTLYPHEILLHPDSVKDVFVQLTVPTAGVYRAIGIFRDLSIDSDYSFVGRGVIAKISMSPSRCCAVSRHLRAEDGTSPVVLDARRLELAAGDTVIFSVNNNGAYYSDSTGLQAFLFPDAPPTADEVINLDINGRQPADPEPVTYTGIASYAGTGMFWNALYGLEDTVQEVSGTMLKTAGGTRSLVCVSIASTDDTNLMFDSVANNASAAGNDLLNDYLYVNHTNRLVITGLVPDSLYDLHLFTACGRKSASGDTRAVFVGQTRWYGGESGKEVVSDTYNVLVFSGLVADAAGVIEGLLVGTPRSQGVFNGFQLVGEFTFPPPGLAIMFR